MKISILNPKYLSKLAWILKQPGVQYVHDTEKAEVLFCVEDDGNCDPWLWQEAPEERLLQDSIDEDSCYSAAVDISELITDRTNRLIVGIGKCANMVALAYDCDQIQYALRPNSISVASATTKTYMFSIMPTTEQLIIPSTDKDVNITCYAYCGQLSEFYIKTEGKLYTPLPSYLEPEILYFESKDATPALAFQSCPSSQTKVAQKHLYYRTLRHTYEELKQQGFFTERSPIISC